MRYLTALFFIVFIFSLNAQQAGFTMEYGDEGEVKITLSGVEGISTAELYRETESGGSVIIFEFMRPGEVFVEKGKAGTCYFLKIYSEDGSMSTTGRQCYSGIKYIGSINNGILLLILIMLLSAVIPFFIRGKFIDNMDSDYAAIIRQIVLMMDEGGGKLSVSTQYENRHSMLFYMASFLVSDIHGAGVRGQHPAPEDNAEFKIKVAGGYADMIFDETCRHDSKAVCFSSTVAGMGIDALNGRRCIVSIEPFLAGMIFDGSGTKGFKPSGAYIFIIVAALLIIVLSVLRTLGLTGGIQ